MLIKLLHGSKHYMLIAS